jgi:hypothetical protein
MSTANVQALLDELRREREATLDALTNISRDELRYSTGHQRWSSARRAMLRFGDHLREHALQVRNVRRLNNNHLTEPQMMLAMAEQAWGDLLASVVGLTDEELDRVPGPGQWNVRQVFEHMIKIEREYRQMIEKAVAGKVVEPGE